MNQKRLRKQSLAWLLVLSMVLSLFGGIAVPQQAEAADSTEAKIEFGTKKVFTSGYYTYPELEVTIPEVSGTRKYIHNLTVTVDSGYMTTTETQMEDHAGTKVTGQGILASEAIDGSDVSEGSGLEDLSGMASSKYESISFSFDSAHTNTDAAGVTSDVAAEFLRKIHFTTSAEGNQKVTITATTLTTADLTVEVDGTDVRLYYYNGHFYGLVEKQMSWMDAYEQASSVEFLGVEGYLATLTSRGEDRFIYSTFPLGYGNMVKEGWIGCTRATLESVKNGTAMEDLPTITSTNDSNFKWRWVSGPETGIEFGLQTNACGFDDGTGSWSHDGGFETYDGMFSNWKEPDDENNNMEPNGGGSTLPNEAFGYYGRYPYGRWNDNAGTEKKGYYIEFGGGDDDATLQENLKDEFIVTETDVQMDVVNPDATAAPATKTPEVTATAAVTPDADATDTPAPSGTPDAGATVTPSASASTSPTVAPTQAPTPVVAKVLTGKPVVELADSSAKVEVGTTLKANTEDVGPDGVKAGTDYTYKWFVQTTEEGKTGWTEIKGQTGDTIKLDEDTINHNVMVEIVGVNDYENSIPLDSDPYFAEQTKEAMTGSPTIDKKNSKDDLEPGTVIQADVSDMGPDDMTDVVDYQWYRVDPETGEETPVGKNKSEYVLTDDDQGMDIIVKVTPKDGTYYEGTKESNTIEVPEAKVTPTATPDVVLQEIGNRPVIENLQVDDEGNTINKVGTELKANIDAITPTEAQKTDGALTYQWYTRGSDGKLTAIDGATDQTLVLTEDLLNQSIVVAVTGVQDEGYYGTRNSVPYNSAEEKIAITGEVSITNETKGVDDDGKTYAVVREGTILTANIDGVDPDASHDTLTYQWYTKDEDGKLTPIEDATDKSYVLTSAEVGKEIVVEVTGNGKYKGSLDSDPYDAKRTDSDVKIETTKDGKRTITVTPTMEDTIYAIIDVTDESTVPLVDVPTVDENGFTIYPTTYYEGEYSGYYYRPSEGGDLVFTVDKDKEYLIVAHHLDTTNTDKTLIGPDIDDVEITDYDDKDTRSDNEDDTISIEVSPADTDYKYAILQKVDGKYTQLTIDYDKETGEYVYQGTNAADDADGADGSMSAGGEGKVIFSNLPADGTYKIVAIPSDKTWTQVAGDTSSNLDPSQIEGGSQDVVSTPKAILPETSTPADTPSTDPDASTTPVVSTGAAVSASPVVSGSPAASAAPSTSTVPGATGGSSLTQEQQNNVDTFIKEYCTDPSGNMITEITDLTKDIIQSGESTWNKLTAEEQSAINERLKAGGSPYTYPELLEKAKAYKIPGFKLRKVMKKKTKSKLKLLKCKGADVVVTSTNKKVAVVTKKGVIKAKKKGKARLTITVVKGNYSNRLIINVQVRKKFRNATELKKFKSKVVKTPTILIAKKRVLKKSTKIKVYGLEKNAKVKYKSYNKKALPISKKGRYTAKKRGRSLMRVTVKQNDKTYFLYLYVTAFKKGEKS